MQSFILFQKRGKGSFLFSGATSLYRKSPSLIVQNIILSLRLTHRHFLLTMDFLDQGHSRRRIHISKVRENLQYFGEKINSVCIFPAFADNECILIISYEKITLSLVESHNSCYYSWYTFCGMYCRIFLLYSFSIPASYKYTED